MRVGADDAIDALARRAMRGTPVLDWGVHQGMHVFGADTPAGCDRLLWPHRDGLIWPHGRLAGVVVTV
jgi:hypothetical protein